VAREDKKGYEAKGKMKISKAILADLIYELIKTRVERDLARTLAGEGAEPTTPSPGHEGGTRVGVLCPATEYGREGEPEPCGRQMPCPAHGGEELKCPAPTYSGPCSWQLRKGPCPWHTPRQMQDVVSVNMAWAAHCAELEVQLARVTADRDRRKAEAERAQQRFQYQCELGDENTMHRLRLHAELRAARAELAERTREREHSDAALEAAARDMAQATTEVDRLTRELAATVQENHRWAATHAELEAELADVSAELEFVRADREGVAGQVRRLLAERAGARQRAAADTLQMAGTRLATAGHHPAADLVRDLEAQIRAGILSVPSSSEPDHEEPECVALCDYPVTGYHAKRGGRVLCDLPEPDHKEPEAGR
jgi:hypothetical protein